MEQGADQLVAREPLLMFFGGQRVQLPPDVVSLGRDLERECLFPCHVLCPVPRLRQLRGAAGPDIVAFASS